jgi:hypothetical protein
MRKYPFITGLLILITVFSCSNPSSNNQTYTLTTMVSPQEGGSIDPASGSYSAGEQISLHAMPTEGWRFVRWEGDWASTIHK